MGEIYESRRTEHGFTVVELVVAVSILAFVVIAIMGAIQFASTATAQTAARERALNLGSEVIERARNMPYDSVGTKTPEGVFLDPPGDILTSSVVDGFTITTEVDYARDPVTNRAEYKNVTVVVSWDNPRSNSIELETAVMGKSNLGNTGDVLVTALDADSGDPVNGVTVTMDPSSGSNRTKYTDAAGEAFFGYVGMGPVSFAASRTGYLIDLSPLAGASVPVDALAQYTIYVQLPSTAIVTVTDSDGAPVAGATVTLVGDTAPTSSMTDTTGADGRATFNSLFKGDHDVTVSASGYAPATSILTVTSGDQTVEHAVTLAQTRSLNVLVRRASNGQPFPGATVRVQGPDSAADVAGSPATSASSGVASFELAGNGTYTITVSRSGYTTQTRVLVVSTAGVFNEVVDLDTEAPGNLQVRVTRTNGTTPRSDIQVRVTGPNGYSRTQDTDSNGWAYFNNLTPGTYEVRARRSSSRYYEQDATIAAGGTTDVYFQW